MIISKVIAIIDRGFALLNQLCDKLEFPKGGSTREGDSSLVRCH